MKIYHWKSNLLDYELSSNAKLMGFVLSEFYREGKDCYPGITTLLEVSGLGSRNTILKSIKELVKFKIIKISKKRKPGNSRESNVYKFVGVDNEPLTEPPSKPLDEPSTELSTDGSLSIPSTEPSTELEDTNTITKTTKKGDNPPPNSSHLILTPLYPPNEEKKGVFKNLKNEGGEFSSDELIQSLTGNDIVDALNDKAKEKIKKYAPGQNIFELADVYITGTKQGRRNGKLPKDINVAFPAWCESYMKGIRKNI